LTSPRPKGSNRHIHLRTLVTSDWRLTYDDGFSFGKHYRLTEDAHEPDNLWNDQGMQTVKHVLSEQLLYSMIDHQDRSLLPDDLALVQCHTKKGTNSCIAIYEGSFVPLIAVRST
jgi:hypothetical protein